MNVRNSIAFALFALICAPGASPGQAAQDSVRGFLAVEPFEVRLEAIVKVSAYRQSWRLEGETIDSVQKQVILDNVATLLASGVNLFAPDTTFDFTGRSVRFIQRDAEKGYASDERQEIPVDEALVGITLASGAANVRELEVEWLWFAPGQERLVVEIASRGKPSARYVTPQSNRFSWSLPDTVTAPNLLEVPAVKRETFSPMRYLLALAILLAVFASVEVIRKKQKSPAWVGWMVIAAVACGFLSFKIKVERVQFPAADDIEPLTYALLRNIYHAFDFREETAIYDTLEKSVSGPLLEDIYVEIRSSLELENNGGPRVKVYEIALREAKAEDQTAEDDGDSLTVLANWATIGEVTHWGHTHERTNRYEARMVISPVNSDWKVTGLDLLNEERVQKVSRSITAPPAAPGPVETKEEKQPAEAGKP